MKFIQPLAFLSFLLVIVGCEEEEYKKIDPSTFNQEIALRTDLNEPEDLIYAYYQPETEGKAKVELTVEEIAESEYRITLIHDGLLDDSQRAVKYIMEAERIDSSWLVSSIKTNWKCWEGRGHEDWGIEYCN